jgi:hypothetical protein
MIQRDRENTRKQEQAKGNLKKLQGQMAEIEGKLTNVLKRKKRYKKEKRGLETQLEQERIRFLKVKNVT